MEAVTWSEVSYGQTPLPRLRIAPECARRDSLSSSRTQDSGYNSDPDISLSPLHLVSPNLSPNQIPHTSSDFTFDSAALLDVKEVASSRTKRLAVTTCNPLLAKKRKIAQETASAPRIEVTSNPTPIDDITRDTHWASAPKYPTKAPSCVDDIELWINENLHSQNHPKQRNLSIVSLDSTGSCDMYSNTDNNSDDEHTMAGPSTLSKATLKTIELIMRKIEVNLGHAAYMQCTGNHTSKTQGNGNTSRKSRPSQSSSSKRKARPDESLPPEDPDEDDSSKRRRVSVTTTTEDSETGPRFACPFFKHDPNRYQGRRTCVGPGWPTVHRVKEHLYRCHAQPIFCPRCYAMFDLDADFSAHIRGVPCQISAPQPIEGIDRKTFESLKKRSPALRLEEDKWRDVYQLVFPEVAPADIPSPYYDSASPTEESRRFRRALLERVRDELFATAENAPGPVEQSILRQVAGIIRRCETELLDSFHAPALSRPPSRRTSVDGTPPRSHANALPPTGHADLPPPEGASPRADLGVMLAQPGWSDWGVFASSQWVDWNVPFPPAPEARGVEREDVFLGMGAPVWTR